MDTVKIAPPMPDKNHCPQCGTPLPFGALAGLCPACLLKMGAAADTVTDAKQKAFVPPSVAELAAKFPQLEILELVGKGGMGAVYKARQKQLDRIVALKILPPGIGDEPAFAERFAREAQALAKLNHPNIVTLYEFGNASGQFYFLMEFVDGVNLRQLLAGNRIAPREALAIVPQICDALQFAHDQGIVHRDIKPENILLDRRGRVKVADFGLAKIIEPGRAELPIGQNTEAAPQGPTGVMGTPNYMSPEQISAPGEVDHRADIYALGVVFYQMLTGELPGKKIAPPSTKVHIDVRLDEIVLRALEKKPELRYQQVSEVKTCVETILGSSPAARDEEVQTKKTESQNPKAKSQNSKGWFSSFSPFGAPLPTDHFSRAIGRMRICFIPFQICAAVVLFLAISGQISGPAWNFCMSVFPLFGPLLLVEFLLRLRNERKAELRYQQVSEVKTCVETIVGTPLGSSRREADQTKNRNPRQSWWTWSPLQSPEVGKICAHLTKLEQNHLSTLGLVISAWVIGTGFDLPAFIRSNSGVGRWIVAGVWAMLFLVSIPMIQRMLRYFLCSTTWAKAQGYRADQMRLFSFTRRTMFKVIVFAGLATVLIFAQSNLFTRLSGVDELSQNLKETAAWTQEQMARLATQNKAAAQNLSFGPTVNRVIQSTESGTNLFLNLDTGQLLTPPENMRALFNESFATRYFWEWHDDPRALKMREWLRSSGANLMVRDGGRGSEELEIREAAAFPPNVISNGVVVPFGFDQADASYLGTRLQRMLDGLLKQHQRDKTIWTLQPGFDSRLNSHRDSFCFKTRKGAVGILQILNAEDNPRGVKIRYKLVQNFTPLSAVQNWLALADAGAYSQTWDTAAASFRADGQKDAWVKLLEKVRQPLGQVISRKEISTQTSTALSGMPDGSYFVAQFETSFAALPGAVETVEFMQEKDGQWRAIYYLIRPRTAEQTAAVTAAQKWLTGIDGGNYAQSWVDASDYFQGALTQDKWIAAMESVRKPLGELKIRTVDSAVTETHLPGTPDGKYVVMQFETAFSKMNSATETVTFSLETDGAWKACGYYIK